MRELLLQLTARRRARRRTVGQSLVEFTILLPLLLIMLSGLIEFGFLLNDYLDVIDAAREAARFAANDDPIGTLPTDAPPHFWYRAWRNSRGSLFTASGGRIDWTPTDPLDCSGVNGDIVVSAFEVLGDSVIARMAPGYPNGVSNCGNYASKFTTGDVQALISGASTNNSGVVLVEIYYEYFMILGLPWLDAFLPDPITLHAYSFMPNAYAEPTSTPSP